MVPLTYDSFDLLPEPTEKLVMVPTEPLVEAFHAKHLTHSELARRASVFRAKKARPDATAVRRALASKRVHYETAVMLCRGLGIPPHEAGV